MPQDTDYIITEFLSIIYKLIFQVSFDQETTLRISATNLRRDGPVGCVLRTIVDPAGRPGRGAKVSRLKWIPWIVMLGGGAKDSQVADIAAAKALAATLTDE